MYWQCPSIRFKSLSKKNLAQFIFHPSGKSMSAILGYFHEILLGCYRRFCQKLRRVFWWCQRCCQHVIGSQSLRDVFSKDHGPRTPEKNTYLRGLKHWQFHHFSLQKSHVWWLTSQIWGFQRIQKPMGFPASSLRPGVTWKVPQFGGPRTCLIHVDSTRWTSIFPSQPSDPGGNPINVASAWNTGRATLGHRGHRVHQRVTGRDAEEGMEEP